MPSQTFCRPDGDDQQPAEAVLGRGEAGADGHALGQAVDAHGPHDKVEAPAVAVVPGGVVGAVVVMMVALVAGLVRDVLVVPARMAVRDEAIHGDRDQHAGEEAARDEREAPEIEARGGADPGERLVQQAQRRGGEHQPGAEAEDAVVAAAGQLLHEQEGERAEPGGEARRERGEQNV